MNIKTIEYEGIFNASGKVELEFPRTGVVLVTGENGAGKSTMIEAVAVAFWNETLRGTTPWSGEDGKVVVETHEGLRVTRTRKGGSVKMSFTLNGAKTKYETPTKAQEALEKLVGSWDVWHRSSVFSSSDAEHFSTARDADRKRLFEAVLGIDQFDAALEACRADLKREAGAVAIAQGEVNVLRQRKAGEEQRLADAGALGDDKPEDVAELTREYNRLQAMVEATDKEMRPLVTKARAAAAAGGENAGAITALKRMLERLQAETCPTCQQPIPQQLRDDITARTQREEQRAQEAAKAARSEAEGVDDAVSELTGERQKLCEKVRDIEGRLSRANTHNARVSQLRKTRASAEQELAKVTEELARKEAKLAEGTAEVAILKAVERVLGTRGVRAHVLSKALGGLEASANSWLSRIGGGMTISIKPYKELAKGGTSDEITCEIVGRGNSNGYRATSGGERRRLDVALVLALGEVSAAAHGRIPGTIFSDEVFDALDADGVGRVADALRELASDRCVMVISHNQELVGTMRADQRWKVSGGTVNGGAT